MRCIRIQTGETHPMTRIALAGAALLLLAAGSALAEPTTQVYEVPAGARPHDVAPAPDGKVWYTAQAQGALGILDPATGAVRQVPLGDGARPHGVIAGPDGAAWITDGGLNAIVRVDPATETVKTWPLPDSADDANLNTPAFDRDGVLWFTGQAGFYGRLDPGTGEMQVWEAPEGRGPYGIDVTPAGEVWYSSLAGSYIAHIDRASGRAEVVPTPGEGDGARRVWSDSKGDLWVSLWNVGKLARYAPATREWTTWPLPGDVPRAYAIYVDESDIVWVSDFGANAVLSFDPKSEQFTAYPSSADSADVRQILGRPGEVWLPESGTDRLMVIRTGG
jgi:virginiamycin B lyase